MVQNLATLQNTVYVKSLYDCVTQGDQHFWKKVLNIWRWVKVIPYQIHLVSRTLYLLKLKTRIILMHTGYNYYIASLYYNFFIIIT